MSALLSIILPCLAGFSFLSWVELELPKTGGWIVLPVVVQLCMTSLLIFATLVVSGFLIYFGMTRIYLLLRPSLRRKNQRFEIKSEGLDLDGVALLNWDQLQISDTIHCPRLRHPSTGELSLPAYTDWEFIKQIQLHLPRRQLPVVEADGRIDPSLAANTSPSSIAILNGSYREDILSQFIIPDILDYVATQPSILLGYYIDARRRVLTQWIDQETLTWQHRTDPPRHEGGKTLRYAHPFSELLLTCHQLPYEDGSAPYELELVTTTSMRLCGRANPQRLCLLYSSRHEEDIHELGKALSQRWGIAFCKTGLEQAESKHQIS